MPSNLKDVRLCDVRKEVASQFIQGHCGTNAPLNAVQIYDILKSLRKVPICVVFYVCP